MQPAHEPAIPVLQARVRLPEAIADANRAITLARRTGDPALLLQALDVLLVLDGNGAALAEARALVDRIVSAIPNDTMLHSFQASEAVRRVLKL